MTVIAIVMCVCLFVLAIFPLKLTTPKTLLFYCKAYYRYTSDLLQGLLQGLLQLTTHHIVLCRGFNNSNFTANFQIDLCSEIDEEDFHADIL